MRTLCYLLAVVVCGAGCVAPRFVQARQCCCAHCQESCACRKVCRLVCEEKKVEVACWGCKCEEFCVPERSTKGGKHCEIVCADCGSGENGCDCSTPHAAAKRFAWFDWRPGCAKIFTKKKLMKKIETVKVPSYKWVVEDLCPKCEAGCAVTEVDRGAVLPSPPDADAKLLYAVRQ